MAKWQINFIISILTMVSISISACASTANDVPSLGATPTAIDEDGELNDEAKAMAFTQCMRDQGFEYEDPTVDADGNVQIPKPVEGISYTRDDIKASYDVCSIFLEGFTFGSKRDKTSESVDQFVELAACLRDKGYDQDDPTAETLEIWLADFRVEFDWDDPDAATAYEECSGESLSKNEKGQEK